MPRPSPTGPVEFVVSPDGTRIAYRRIGSGRRTVVVIHGGLASSLSWLAVARRLADRFAFLLVDRRGRGASGDAKARHSLQREVEDAGAVLGVAGAGAALIGHSYGGAVALETARVAKPGEIGRLVLYEPAVRVSDLIPAAELDRLDELVAQGELERVLDVGLAQLAAAGLVRSDGAGERPRPSPQRDALIEIAATIPRELRAVAALGSAADRYSTIQTPTLLMVGTTSPQPQQRNCAALAAVLRDARVARLDGQGHVAHNSDPDHVAERIASFLA